MPFQIHNYAHNNEWLARSLIRVGRVRDAVNVSKNLIETPRHPKLNAPGKAGSAASFGGERLLETIVLYELWSDYIVLAHTPYLASDQSEEQQLKHVRWLGAAHLALGNQIQGEEQVANVANRLADLKSEQEKAASQAEEKARGENKDDAEVAKARQGAAARFDKRKGAIEKALAHLHGLQAAAAGDHKAAAELFEKAGDLPKPHLARAYVQAGDNQKAEKLAREAADAGKNEVYPLATLIEVLHAAGKEDEAKQAFERLRGLSATSDLKAPIFDRLDDLAAGWGFSAGWRLAYKQAADVGSRPELESLGPLLWRPSQAARWILPDSDGETIGLAHFGGRPVVVIFYLGYGCLECARQLKAFDPMAKEFNDAGIQLVAISTDSVDDLRRSVSEATQGSDDKRDANDPAGENERAKTVATSDKQPRAYPIRLLSNSDLRAFKAYGAYDDFEQRPLHGTFLVDGAGQVRFAEVGAKPFTDAAFLLEEAKRVMALDR
jgi:peroxiredoxin